MKKDFTIKAKVWRWPGDAGWHFVTLDKKVSEGIRQVYTKGFVKVQVKVGHTIWNTSLFPHTVNKKSKQVEYLICINKKVLRAEDIYPGDEIKVFIKVI